jgi:hypothetical protein
MSKPRGDVREQSLRVRLQVTGSPIPRLGERRCQAVAHDNDLTAIEFAHARLDHMNIHLLAPVWPGQQFEILLTQASRVLTQFLPAPPLGYGIIGNPQPAIACACQS